MSREMTKWLLGLFATIIIVGSVYMFSSQPAQTPAQQAVSTDDAQQVASQPTDKNAKGRYVAYNSQLVSDDRFDQTILFFYAPECPECRVFDGELSAADMPDRTQILRIDYDNSAESRKKYGVTTQTTFVRVDSTGKKQAMWIGYGHTKTVDAVIKNLK